MDFFQVIFLVDERVCVLLLARLLLQAACMGLCGGLSDPLLPFRLLLLDWYLLGVTLSLCAAAAHVAVAFLLLGSLKVDSSAATTYDDAFGSVSFHSSPGTVGEARSGLVRKIPLLQLRVAVPSVQLSFTLC